MTTITQVYEESQKLAQRINDLFKLSRYNEYSDLSGVETDREDPEELLLYDEMQDVMELLGSAVSRIKYLGRTIYEYSVLRKNERGRYETESGREYCSGELIEALVQDERHNVPYWTISGIEHDGHDYYIVGYKNVSMEGLRVRIRQSV